MTGFWGAEKSRRCFEIWKDEELSFKKEIFFVYYFELSDSNQVKLQHEFWLSYHSLHNVNIYRQKVWHVYI